MPTAPPLIWMAREVLRLTVMVLSKLSANTDSSPFAPGLKLAVTAAAAGEPSGPGSRPRARRWSSRLRPPVAFSRTPLSSCDLLSQCRRPGVVAARRRYGVVTATARTSRRETDPCRGVLHERGGDWRPGTGGDRRCGRLRPAARRLRRHAGTSLDRADGRHLRTSAPVLHPAADRRTGHALGLDQWVPQPGADTDAHADGDREGLPNGLAVAMTRIRGRASSASWDIVIPVFSGPAGERRPTAAYALRRTT